MRRMSLLLTLGIILGGAAMAGCRARTEVTPNPPPPVVRAGGPSAGEAQVQQAELASRFPMAAPAENVHAAALDDGQCIACHTDEAAVKELAQEPEEEEKLSEGEG